MTTSSETRAGKLPELPQAKFWLDSMVTDKFRPENLAYMAGGSTHVSTVHTIRYDEPYYTADQMRAYALEALAASEPVERQWHLPWKHPANVAARASEAVQEVVTPPNVAYVTGYVQGAYDFCQSAEPPAQEEVIAAANDAVKQDLPSTAPEQPGKGVPPKPFPALGAWYPVNILGYPMREFAPDKWESARWPSEQPSNGGAALRKYVATLRKAHEHGATDADLAFKCAADDIERILGTPQPSDPAEGAAYMAKELGEVGTCGEQQ